MPAQRLGPLWSLRVGAILLDLAAIVLALAPPGAPSALVLGLLAAAMLAVIGVIMAAHWGHPKGAWYLTLATALIAVSLLLVNGHTLV